MNPLRFPRFASTSASRRFVALVGAFTMNAGTSDAATNLAVGDISIASMNADAPDGFTFVLLKDVDNSTVIKFMDNGFKGSGSATATGNVRGTENVVVWTSGTALSAGTVIRMVNTSGSVTTVTGGGTATGALSGLSNNGDQIFVYQGSGTGSNITGIAATETFSGTILYGLNFKGTGTNGSATWLTTGADSSNASYLPSQLNVADANISLGNNTNTNFAYTAARSGLTGTIYRAALADVSNWTGYATNQTLSTTGFTLSGSASLSWDSNGKTTGTGGSGTWDSTTAARFSNGSNDTFLRWVDSSTGNEHTAVFGGTAGTVSVAAGGVTASGLQFDTTGYTVQNNTVNLSAASTPAINVASGASATITSAIASTGGLSKTGDGALTLGGTSTYTGSTSVSAGSLFVNGALSNTSGTTVSDTATLGGSGSIANGVTVASGGTLVVGANDLDSSIGTFTLGSLALSGLLEMGATGALTYDKLITTGALSVTGGTIAFRTSGYTIGFNTSFDLADFSGTANGATFDFSGASVQQFGAWDTSAFASSGVITYVPEPEAALLGGLGLLMLLRRRR